MKRCIVIGNRLEALNVIIERFKVIKIFTKEKSFIDLKFKNSEIINYYNKSNYLEILNYIYNSDVNLVFQLVLITLFQKI